MPLTVGDSLRAYIVPLHIDYLLNSVQNGSVFKWINAFKCLRDHLLQLTLPVVDLKVVNNALVYRLIY